MKNRWILILSSLLLCMILTGCGEDKELTGFKSEIDAFCTEIAEIDRGINNIDPQSENAKRELLDYLDQADDVFKRLADLAVPKEFSYIEELADKASEDMTQAVSLYHDAFGDTSYNEYVFDYASEYYKRAYKRLTYIITLLHGDIPEDGNVILYDEEEGTTSGGPQDDDSDDISDTNE
ncbi:MAG: hypothetical protein HDR26_07555 [Lachnospiraceae bacterium]|nr:hypothetical protein [Lachnospiraceae bacterium]